MDSIAIIGASGRSGAALCSALLAAGQGFVPVVRNLERWRATQIPVAARVADIADAPRMQAALAETTAIVSCAHGRHAAAMIAAAPPTATLVLLGSTRRFSRWLDQHGYGVRAGEAAFLASGRRGAMLHPTMIYGATGEDNVQRLAALLRRIPVAPLPGGGRALVQPIYQGDLTACLLAALAQDWPGAEALVVAGPRPIAYRDFVAAVAHAAGLRQPRILPLPATVLMALASLTRMLPFLPRIRPAEVRRLLEDKAFDTAPMRARLGVVGRTLEEGLRQTFGAEMLALPPAAPQEQGRPAEDPTCPSSTASRNSTRR